MTSFGIKLLAMISMIFDHFGLIFLQNNALFRIIGRLAFPIFAFQLAVGYSHARNKEKHIIRMLAFAVLSQLPFMFFVETALPGFGHFLNIGFTFSIALLGMYVIENIKNFTYKSFLLPLILLLSCALPIDYGFTGVLLCISFYIFRNHKYLNLLSAFFIIVLKVFLEQEVMKFAMIYALLPIFLYNGKKGLDNKFSKYLFYVFYPAHLILFAVIKLIM